MSARSGGPDCDPADYPEGVWEVPVELVLACPSASAMKGLVRKRMGLQDWPYPSAIVFKRGKAFFAEVRFHGAERPALLFPLDVPVAENMV